MGSSGDGVTLLNCGSCWPSSLAMVRRKPCSACTFMVSSSSQATTVIWILRLGSDSGSDRRSLYLFLFTGLGKLKKRSKRMWGWSSVKKSMCINMYLKKRGGVVV